MLVRMREGETKEELVEVAWKNSRTVRIKLVYGQEAIHVISAYASQVGCGDTEKETFWREIDKLDEDVEMDVWGDEGGRDRKRPDQRYSEGGGSIGESTGEEITGVM